MTSPAEKLIIVSGPAGAGKTTVLKRVLELEGDALRCSVSATTRPPRPGEVDGKSYHFLSPEEFESRRRAGEFLECAQVHGDWYGTLKSEVAPSLKAGEAVVLEIDVQGMQAVVQHYPEALTIFIRPASLEELEQRLRGRKTETEEALQRRLQVARSELELAHTYRYQVENQDLDQAVAEVREIISKTQE